MSKSETRRTATSYHCHTHGWWDASKESGCPTCVSQARREISRLREELDKALRLLSEVRGRWQWQGPAREDNFEIMLREIDNVIALARAEGEKG